MKNAFGICLAILSVLLMGRQSAGQGWSLADVDRDNVEIRWADTGDWLWYEVDAGQGGAEYFVVDLANGERKPLFDSVDLSAALGQLLNQEVSPAELSELVVLDVQDEGDEFLFEYRKNELQWRAGRLKPVDVDDDGELADYDRVFSSSRRSRSGGDELEMKLSNETKEPLTCFWINGSGVEVKYETLKPGQEFSQHTFAGHLWSLRDKDGDEAVRLIASRATRRLRVSDEMLGAFRDFDKMVGRPGSSRRSRSDYYLRDFNIWSRKSGAEQQLTDDGDNGNRYQRGFRVSPDGKFLAAIREEQAEKRQLHLIESSPAKGLQPRHRSIDYVKPGDPIDQPRLRIFNLETQDWVEVADAVTPNPWSISRLQWLPSSERLLCLYNERGHQKLQVLSIDPRTGDASIIVDERSDTFVDYSQKTFLHLEENGENLIWASERSGFNHLYRIPTGSDSKAGAKEAGQDADNWAVPEPQAITQGITQGEWVVRRVVEVDETKGVIWFEASGIVDGQDPYYRHLCRVNLDGTGFVQVTAGDGDHRWEFSPDRSYYSGR